MQAAVFLRRHIRDLRERTVEGADGAEARLLRNARDLLVGRNRLFTSFVDSQRIDIGAEADAELLVKQMGDVVFVQVKRLGDLLQRDIPRKMLCTVVEYAVQGGVVGFDLRL